MENLLFLGVPILKHIRVSEKMYNFQCQKFCFKVIIVISTANKFADLNKCLCIHPPTSLGISVPFIKYRLEAKKRNLRN